MAWDEWEQLKSQAAERQSTRMQLNQVDGGGGYSAMPSQTGDLKVRHDDLVKIGSAAHHLYNQLWDKARVASPTSDSAAGDLSKQGFALGSGLQRPGLGPRRRCRHEEAGHCVHQGCGERR